jgi:hypothetical protein
MSVVQLFPTPDEFRWDKDAYRASLASMADDEVVPIEPAREPKGVSLTGILVFSAIVLPILVLTTMIWGCYWYWPH